MVMQRKKIIQISNETCGLHGRIEVHFEMEENGISFI